MAQASSSKQKPNLERKKEEIVHAFDSTLDSRLSQQKKNQ